MTGVAAGVISELERTVRIPPPLIPPPLSLGSTVTDCAAGREVVLSCPVGVSLGAVAEASPLFSSMMDAPSSMDE